MRSNYFVLVLLVVALCYCGGDACHPIPPPEDECTVSCWSAWQKCSGICNVGTHNRTRNVTSYTHTHEHIHSGSGKHSHTHTHTSAVKNGPACPALSETQDCYMNKCPVQCSWERWSQWSECSPCSPKSRSRTRKVATAALFGGRACSGSSYESDFSCISTSTCQQFSCKPNDFACSDQLTCVRPHLQCNGDDDCTDFSDEIGCDNTSSVCQNHYDGIPNIDLAGAGYDIVRDHESGSIMDNTQYNGRCLTARSGDHDEIFRQPANIQYYRFQVSGETSFAAESYESAKDFFQDEKDDITRKINSQASYTYRKVVNLGGKVSKNSNSKTRRIIEESSRSDSKYFKVTSGVTVAQFRLLRHNFILSVPFRRRLAKLPDHYDYGKYSEVIDDFGTHFYSSGKLGGKYEFIYRFSREALQTSGLTDSEQKGCLAMEASIRLFGFSLGGGGWSKCSNNSLSIKNKGSFTRSANEVISNIRGGTSDTAASLSFFNQNTPNSEDYDAWVQTVKNNPAVIDFTLSPISNTLTGQRKTNMERALYEYLKRFDPAVCKGSCDNGGSFIVVERGKVCKCLCAAGFTGPSCSTKIQRPVKGEANRAPCSRHKFINH